MKCDNTEILGGFSQTEHPCCLHQVKRQNAARLPEAPAFPPGDAASPDPSDFLTFVSIPWGTPLTLWDLALARPLFISRCIPDATPPAKLGCHLAQVACPLWNPSCKTERGHWAEGLGIVLQPSVPSGPESVILQTVPAPPTYVLYQPTSGKPTVAWPFCLGEEEDHDCSMPVCPMCLMQGASIYCAERQDGVWRTSGVGAKSWQHLGHIWPTYVLGWPCQRFFFFFLGCFWVLL